MRDENLLVPRQLTCSLKDEWKLTQCLAGGLDRFGQLKSLELSQLVGLLGM